MKIEKESEKENEEGEIEFKKENEENNEEEKSEEESEKEEMEFKNKSENESKEEIEEEIETEKESEKKNIIEKSLSFICENRGKITPKEYQTFINQVLFIQMNLQTSKKSISTKTSYIWLKKLGLKSQLRKKDIYFNGYKKEDVIEYRKVFLNKMLQYENFIPNFEGENMIQQNLSLLPNKKMHILVTYDECRLKLLEEEIILNPNVPIEARKFLKPEKNEEGCIFTYKSRTMAKDALNVNNMNVNLGGK
ncbi:hypothetical protein C1646_772411 [Rhizophagus diaphanus]|nr:hypothetical protein C1646_772411 [Rhizophagus diaphanus] [Rhizophagus sp. MUCL 43196]